MFKRVPGTKDILPEEIPLWHAIEAISRNIFLAYNYKEIRPPLIEEAALFHRSLGESTEIVQKQMFRIATSTDVYALRPEATASIVRAYIENNLDKKSRFLKCYYIGPMFRMERPQKGRLRQFHHIGCEAIGSYEPGIDAEVISLADALLKAFSIGGYTILVNSLGCAGDKQGLIKMLHNRLKDKLPLLCEDCQVRYNRNVLRILDCKNEACQEIVKGLKIDDTHLCQECKTHFANVTQKLDLMKVAYERSPYLVRGLDYYTRTVFEITHKDFGGQQNALGAGGRYDTLTSDLGGPAVGAIGFAFGMERLLLVTEPPSHQVISRNLVFVITLGEEAEREGIKLLHALREHNIASDTEYENKSLKGALRKADDANARYVVILGENELKKKTVMLKDMVSGEQKEVRIDNLIKELMTNDQIQMSK